MLLGGARLFPSPRRPGSNIPKAQCAKACVVRVLGLLFSCFLLPDPGIASAAKQMHLSGGAYHFPRRTEAVWGWG